MASNPPGESATTASQISPAIVSPTHRKNSAGRQPGRAVAAAAGMASSREEHSTMKGLCVGWRAFSRI